MKEERGKLKKRRNGERLSDTKRNKYSHKTERNKEKR
jgi:hypothetical protein